MKRDIWTTWDWRREPDAPRTWTDPERRVVIVEGLHEAIRLREDAVIPAMNATEAAPKSTVFVCVEPVTALVDMQRNYDSARKGIPARLVPALRTERQADLSVANIAPLMRVSAPHRALIVTPREEIDLDPPTCAVCKTRSPTGTIGGNPYCSECDREMVFGTILDPCADALEQPGVNIVIVEGPTGLDAWPMHPAWVRKIRDTCAEAGVAFAFTGWGAWVPNADNRVCEKRVVDGVEFCQVGKIGHDQRLLDGVEHLALPEGL